MGLFSKRYGGIGVQQDDTAIVIMANSSNYYDDTMVLGKRSVSRFRVELGEGLTSYSAYVGFISTEDFVKDRSIVSKGWSMAFVNDTSNYSPQYISRIHPLCIYLRFNRLNYKRIVANYALVFIT